MKTKHRETPTDGPTYSQVQTPAQKRWQADLMAKQAEAKRTQCTLFKFWSVCADKRCRRARACNGDPYACFERWWPHVPDDAKHWFRALLKAGEAGLAPREAAQAATEEVARLLERQKHYAALGWEAGPGRAPAPAPAAGAAPPGPQPAREGAAPRVRIV